MPDQLTASQLNSESIVQTIERLRKRISERFPGSGLSRVCDDLLQISRQTQARARWIATPIVGLRLMIWLLIVVCAAIVIWTLLRLPLSAEISGLAELVQTLEAGTNELIVLGAGVFFLVSLERRIKRRRALSAIHELRSVAHIIDMHQLTKDPDRVKRTWVLTPHSPRETMSAFELHRYLDYCSEMLSLTSKLAALYVEKFEDEVALGAANDVETLTTGLSRKIWQKIMILHDYETRSPVLPSGPPWSGDGGDMCGVPDHCQESPNALSVLRRRDAR